MRGSLKDGFHLFSDGVQCVDAYGKWQIVEFEVPVIMEGIQGDVVVEPEISYSATPMASSVYLSSSSTKRWRAPSRASSGRTSESRGVFDR